MYHAIPIPTNIYLHHVAIQVCNLQISSPFYQKLFGLQVHQHFYLEEEEIIWLQGNGWRLELISINQAVPTPPPSTYHFAIEVSHLTEWEQICMQYQIPIIEGPITLSDQTKILFIGGPDGEQIELIESVSGEDHLTDLIGSLN
ncbi:Catechol 2,3-dioxygenase [Thermoactinomyces sp. DSM 45891]|uniref:VOC family protein n=1 Tax=Thermoactinomyces sp. DSM 45891 TaxID=1761907 RepID=UPI0009150391|nr:VOC family protein [Thermoactinomyces sp. DSM 45891]SFX04853.1 Catechol 2,3-dioxygenase [Thermoactinomyces sp. DSM 45891]